MSICPRCRRSVKQATANKTKRGGVWMHKTCPGERRHRKGKGSSWHGPSGDFAKYLEGNINYGRGKSYG